MQFSVDNILLNLHSLYTYVVVPHPYPLALAVNKSPAGGFNFLSRALDGLWRENRGSVNSRRSG